MAKFPPSKDASTKQYFRTGSFDGIKDKYNVITESNSNTDPLGDTWGRGFTRICDRYGSLDISDSITSDGYKELLQYLSIPFPGTDPDNTTAYYVFIQALFGYNINAAVRFVQVFPQNVVFPGPVPAIAPGTKPEISILVPTMSNFSLDLSPFGYFWSLGLTNLYNAFTIASSTTGDIYTPSGSNDLWINTQIRRITKQIANP